MLFRSGVNPIRELQALREDLTGAVQDASSSLTSATTLAALPDPTGVPEAPAAEGPADGGDHAPAEERAANS